MMYFKQILLLAIAIFLFSFSFNTFQAEHGLVTGGVTGIVLLLNKIFGIDIPKTTLIINASFLTVGLIFLGRGFFFKTVLGSIVFYPLFLGIIPVSNLTDDMLVNALGGGVIMGIGISFLLVSGGSSGGTSLLSRILVKYTKIPFSIAIFLFDGTIILCGFLVFGIESGVYALIYVVTATIVSNYFEKNYFKVQQVIITNPKQILRSLDDLSIDYNCLYQSINNDIIILILPFKHVKNLSKQAMLQESSVIISDITNHYIYKSIL